MLWEGRRLRVCNLGVTCVRRVLPAMSPSVAVILVLLGASLAENVPSAEFAKSADSEIEKSAGVHENEVAGGGDGGDEAFLRNFKSLHNATDLQALASDMQQHGAVAAESESGGAVDTAASRVDTGPRVLRGAHHDLSGVPALDHPLFTVSFPSEIYFTCVIQSRKFDRFCKYCNVGGFWD